MVGFINYSKTGKHNKELEEIFKQEQIDKAYEKALKIAGNQKTLDEFIEKMKNDRMSKSKTVKKHLYIRIAKNDSNRKLVRMVKKENKKPKADEQEGSLENTKDAWISVTDKAVFINISLEDVEAIPVSEWENKDGDKKERIVLVGSKALLEKVINGEKKGVPLAYFKE